MSVKEVQQEALKLIKEIDNICRKYNIIYYAEGGTAIGAIRHHGFIPWDDDIDIVMTRTNFNKFVEAFNKEKPNNRILEYPEKNKNYPTVTVKYTDTTTTRIFKSLFLDICAEGFCVDIFILDPIPKDKKFKNRFLNYTEILCPYYRINNESSSFKYNLDRIKIKIFGKEKVLNQYRKKLFRYDESDCEEYLVRYGVTYQTVNIENYGKPRYYPFEDMMIPVPSKVEKILTNFFGDGWYIIPRIDQQETHNVVSNLDIGYRTYIDDYIKYIDKNKTYKVFNKIKFFNMNIAKKDIKIIKDTYRLQLIKDELLLKKNINFDNIEKLFKKAKYQEVIDTLNDYIVKQTASFYKKYKYKFNIDEKIIDYCLKSIIYTGKYYNASSLLQIVGDEKHEEVKNILDKIRLAKQYYYENNYIISLNIIDELLEENPENISAFKIKMDIVIKNKLSKEECLKYKIKLEEYNKKYNDRDLLKYLADIYEKLGEHNKAIDLYKKALIDNDNGLILLEINQILN